MLPQFTFALVPILASLPSVTAHGYVSKVVIDGTTYTGPLPADAAGATNNSPSPIRQIADIGPVKGATNPDINCGLSAQLASLVVPANPGSSMEFYWGNPSGGHWPHVTGPLMTYMASCDTSTCDKFNGSTAKWFKIDEIGKESDGNTWYQQDVANGNPVTLTLPTQVEPGDYLVRHEIITLQLAVSPGGAEFYPSCTQIRIGGSQSGTPNQTVSFPGAYSDTDPGILDPNVYNPGSPYVFPGPPVSNLASTSDMSTSNGGQNNGNPSGTSTSSGSGSQPTQSGVRPTGASSKSTCRLRKQDASLARRQHKRRPNFIRAVHDLVRGS
ncbi:Glycosyl hydrolase family 61 domain containing protein [Lactarius tabidus]